jgi:VCBS repeat-containing protein
VPENSTAVTTVTASDADLPAQTVTFSITGGADSASFSISPSGVLSFNAAPDYENPTDVGGDNVYDVTVTASDGAGGTTSQMISVTVTPVNDNSPLFTSSATLCDAENTTAVTIVTATDADLPVQTVTFAITGGADSASFSITPAGVLSFNAAPDYENPTDFGTDNVYDVTVTASDGAGGTTSQLIIVTVTPVNDNSPVFTSSAAQSVPENTTAVTTVTASDADLPAQTVTFSITGGADSASFSISPSGVLSFNAAPDYENPTDVGGDNVYDVTVTASDGAGGTTSQLISVTVTPVNDAPIFTKGPDQNAAASSGAQTVTTWATGISAGPNGDTSPNVRLRRPAPMNRNRTPTDFPCSLSNASNSSDSGRRMKRPLYLMVAHERKTLQRSDDGTKDSDRRESRIHPGNG